MKKLLTSLVLAASLVLSACAGTLGGIVSPAPLEQTTVDEEALDSALDAYEVVIVAIEGLRDVGLLKPGTPTAKRIAELLRASAAGFKVAQDVRAGLSTEDPVAALQRAQSALRELVPLLRNL